MSDTTQDDGRGNWAWVRPLAWGGAAALILAPLVAMQFTREVDWTVGDFMFAALMLGGIGLAAELAVRISTSRSYRAGAALGLSAGFLLIWANGAVGYIGSEDNPYNQVFFGVVGLAFVGSVIAGFRAAGMAWAMSAAAAAHALAGAYGFPEDMRTGPITLVFVAMWLGSALLFRKSAREQAQATQL